jgi:glycerol-3-phosphate dehydrogenase
MAFKTTALDNKILDREKFVRHIQEGQVWDLVVIGGGATGLGVALDAAARGLKTLLLEQADFAKGTSSRSTKLVHGGVRYLAQGDIGMVYEALYERGLLLHNAPHLVRMQSFVIPNYSFFDKVFYGVGLKIYDLMAGRYRFQKTRVLSRQQVMQQLPDVEGSHLKGGIEYFDGQFDDARLALNLAQTCVEQGGVVLNYAPVTGLLKDPAGKVTGVTFRDLEGGQDYELSAKVVVNATGVFVDDILHMDVPSQPALVRPSQGVHVVLDPVFLRGDKALMIPKTPDGRVLFVVPWHGHLLVGTTDTPLENSSLEPRALSDEIDFILETAGQYLVRKPGRRDVLSVFAGLRPLAAPGKDSGTTKEISRSHKLLVAPSNLVTITGGKWTTYRRMAQDTVDRVLEVAGMRPMPCPTAQLPVHGHSRHHAGLAHLRVYGTDAAGIQRLIHEKPALGAILHPLFPNTVAEVCWAVQHEMARTVEDVLARRLRILFLNARAAMDMAPQVAAIMAAQLGLGATWQQQQLDIFFTMANNYLLEPYTPAGPQAMDYSHLVN